MIRIENVSFSYGKGEGKQLKNIDLKIKRGEFVLLCGRSACGKTTITKLINGLIPHFIEGDYSGNVFIDNKNIKDMEMYEIAETVGSVFQNPKSQFFNLDTDSELAFGLENMGMEPKQIKSRVEEVIGDLEISFLQNRNVFKLSGGEKQILAIASIYAVNPNIYVLDEPSANIDSKGIQLLHNVLKKLKKAGKTIIIAEHRLHYLIDLIDRAIYINKGIIDIDVSRKEFLKMSDEKRKMFGLRSFYSLEKETNEVINQNTHSDLFIVDKLKCTHDNREVLKDVTFSANKGDIIAITGKNGAGKTTLMRCLCGLIKESSGCVKYDSRNIVYKKRRDICYMIMQDVVHQLFSDSVREEFALLNKNISENEIMDILETLDLTEYKEKHPMTLSGGQKQRLAIAVATLSEKGIIVFDEPTSGLDYGNMCRVSKLIKSLSNNRIIFIVTHDDELIEKVCNRKFELNDGRINFY